MKINILSKINKGVGAWKVRKFSGAVHTCQISELFVGAAELSS